MEDKILITGHKVPDTDSICSAIVYSWFLGTRGKLSKAIKLGNVNRETKFVLERFGVAEPEIVSEIPVGSKIIIVDTNNPEELPENLNDLEIIEIIDHHKLVGGISTPSPIEVTMKPVACTATILFEIIKSAKVEIPKNIAGLMLSCVLSDTLKFTSPTTTDIDILIANELAEIASENIESLSEGMFNAKSDLTGFSPRDIIFFDTKAYNLKEKKIRMSTLETVKPEIALSMLSEIKQEMEKVKTEENLDGIFFFVTDILKTNSVLVATSNFEKELAKKGYGKTFDSNETMFLPGVVSRKKQIVPVIEESLQDL